MKNARIQQSSGRVFAAIGAMASAAVLMFGQAAPATAHESVPSVPEHDRLTAERPTAQAPAESRWLAWLGCWAPVTDPLADADAADTDAPTTRRVCVLPGELVDELRILTVEGDDIVRTTPIHADGTRRNVRRGGCSGWETASWSEDGRRILRHSELECEGGLQRVSSGILAMLPGEEWLDIEAMDAGSEQATRVVRRRPAPVPAAVAADFGSLLDERRLAIRTARTDAALSLTLDDVTEAVQATNAKAVNALLLERREGFDVDGGALVDMRREGVPGEVTDLVVALSFPDRFTITGPGAASRRPQEAPELADARYPYGGRRGGFYGRSSCLGLGYGLYDPLAFGFSPFGFGSAFGYGFGCSPFGFGSRFGFFGGRGAPIVIIENDDRERERSGRLTRGEGYRGDASVGRRSGGRRAVPRASRSPDRSPSQSPRSTVRGTRGRSSSGSPASSSSGSSSGRRAKRKGGGGGR